MKTLIAATLILISTSAMAFENCGDPDEIAAHNFESNWEEIYQEYVDTAMYDESFAISQEDRDATIFREVADSAK